MGILGRFILIGFIIWFIIVSFFYNRFAYEIDQFNSKFRNFLLRKDFALRKFDKDGIPYSVSPRFKKDFISPFYVVHYALIYSEIYKEKYEQNGLHWHFDETLKLWNEKPLYIKKEYFINLSNWIVENVKDINGKFHLVYDFDWPYKGYPNNLLKAPWYSGLTDGYSLIVLLRAYDVTQNKKYLEVAKKIYMSSITSISEGGNLNILDGKPWIEEYIDPKVNSYDKLPYVLNGMIYATYGIIAYEKYMNIKDGYSLKLLDSIFSNLYKFKNHEWSYYDLVGTSANLKYHRIHKGLLLELIKYIEKEYPNVYSDYLENIQEILLSWIRSCNNLGFYYILYGEKTFTYWHFIASYIFTLLLYLVILPLILIKRKL